MAASSVKKLFVILTCCLICSISGAAAAAEGDVRITLKAGESLRQVSEQQLGDGDAWQLILRYNGLNNLDAVTAGTALNIPAALYKKLSQHLERSAFLISAANSEGAALLAEQEIAEAVRLREQALRLTQEARLEEAAAQAALAETAAQAALAQATQNQTQSAEAWLAAKSGTVQNRPPDASRWQDAKVEQKLKERERVRTLAQSRCVIQFSDQSQLSLDEHALVAIGSMKKNTLRAAYSNRVSIIKGDILVHIASLNERKNFTVNLPDIAADIRSNHFFTSRDKNATRIANYDGEIDIRAAGAQVTVKKNQATKVEPGQQPDVPHELLPPPKIISPQPEHKLHEAQLLFKWEPVAGAKQYLLEISRRSNFLELIKSDNVSGTSFQWQAPGSGPYFFRIKTIDQDGCPGPFAESVNFFVDLDNRPPFLVLHHPEKDIIIADKEIDVRGEAEKTARLRINGQEVKADAEGRFRHVIALSGDSTVIRAEAEDAAGNVSTVERTVTLRHGKQLIQLDNPEPLISKTEEVAISGQLLPGAQLQINKTPVQAAGRFTHLLHLAEGEHAVEVEAAGPNGQQETLRLHVLVDLQPPTIDVNLKEFERMTSAEQIVLSGTISEEASLTLNGKAVKLTDKSFNETVPLAEGDNSLMLVAEDRAGNQGFWKTSIMRDSQPPEILSATLSPPETKGGEVVRLAARIEDAGAGAAKSGSFVVEVNGQPFKGILKYTAEKSDNFVGSIFILPGLAGKVTLREIRVQDMLGNAAAGAGD